MPWAGRPRRRCALLCWLVCSGVLHLLVSWEWPGWSVWRSSDEQTMPTQAPRLVARVHSPAPPLLQPPSPPSLRSRLRKETALPMLTPDPPSVPVPEQRPEASEPVEPPPLASSVAGENSLLPSTTPEASLAGEESVAALPWPATGAIHYAVFKESLGMEIGRTVQRWTFHEDGRYQLQSVTETSGLAAFLRPTSRSQESSGRWRATDSVAQRPGLRPERFDTRKNGEDVGENALFDWSTVTFTTGSAAQGGALAAGAQDLLSLNFQFAWLSDLENGRRIQVATGRRVEFFELDALGEEVLEVPAGRFRTIHLRVQGNTVTEYWIAREWPHLPVKIRFTDHKGETYVQVAREIGPP